MCRGCRLRRGVKVAHRVADLILRRIEEVRAGNSVDPFIEMGRVRVMLAMLVEIGLLKPDDWCLPSVPLHARGAAIDAMRDRLPLVLDARTMDGAGPFKEVERLILAPHLPAISSLVVEMASAVMLHETILAGMVTFASRPRRRARRVPFDPVVVTLKSALHSDPEAFLVDAQARFDAAREDIFKAKRRIAYLANERRSSIGSSSSSSVAVPVPADPVLPGIVPEAGVTFVSPEGGSSDDSPAYRDLPAPVPFENAASLAMISLVRGSVDNLLRPVEPVARPSPDPAKRLS